MAGGRRRSVVYLLFGLAVFAVGAYLFLSPMVTVYIAQQEADAAIAGAFEQAGAEPPGSDGEDEAAAKAPKEGDAAYEYLLAYNETVRSGQAGGINDPWTTGAKTQDLSSLGLSDGVMGSVDIPALHETMPLYYGASEEHMLYGACIISGTSAPLGQTDSNCVLAAHRGMASGQAMFRDIEDLRAGDVVTIDTPWDTLVYRVAEIQVIDPTDADALKVKPGRDLVTLFTCHPYGFNYQRYLVICERSFEQPPARAQVAGPAYALEQALMPCESRNLVVERWARVAGFALMLIALTSTVRAIIALRR